MEFSLFPLAPPQEGAEQGYRVGLRPQHSRYSSPRFEQQRQAASLPLPPRLDPPLGEKERPAQ